MCIIAVVPQGKDLTDDVLKRCWMQNDDGAGFAYVNDEGRVIVRKAFMKYEDFVKVFRRIHTEYKDKSPFVVHFRIRTHGANDSERTHPFYVGKSEKGVARPALAHNGVLSGMPYDKEKSDTQLFIEKYPKFFSDPATLSSVKQELGKAIGYNKLAVLFPDKQVVVVNEDLGDYNDNGVWFSNTGYKSNPASGWGYAAGGWWNNRDYD